MDESMTTTLMALTAVIGVIFGMAVLLLAESAFVSWSLRRSRSRQRDSDIRAGGIQR